MPEIPEPTTAILVCIEFVGLFTGQTLRSGTLESTRWAPRPLDVYARPDRLDQARSLAIKGDPRLLPARRRDRSESGLATGSESRSDARRLRNVAARALIATANPPRSTGADLSALIVRVAENHDRLAFTALFEHFAPRVKSYLLRLGAPPEAAEELAQEALLTVWRRAPSYDPNKAAASTWIFTIARNLRIDLARRESRPALTPDATEVADAPEQPDQSVCVAQDEILIAEAIRRLPADQAQVVKLAFFADKAHSEIADELGLPLGTVKSRLRLAMGRLRTALTGITA